MSHDGFSLPIFLFLVYKEIIFLSEAYLITQSYWNDVVIRFRKAAYSS